MFFVTFQLVKRNFTMVGSLAKIPSEFRRPCSSWKLKSKMHWNTLTRYWGWHWRN